MMLTATLLATLTFWNIVIAVTRMSGARAAEKVRL